MCRLDWGCVCVDSIREGLDEGDLREIRHVCVDQSGCVRVD